MPTRLITLLHISDLHFGDVNDATADGDAGLDADARAWWQSFLWLFDGYLGHTYAALAQLYTFHRSLKRTEPNLRVVVTGDLTTTGAAGQFQLVNEFLERAAFLGTRTPVGLGLGAASPIPGNHDHWPGRPCTIRRPLWCMQGAQDPYFHTAFPNLPLQPQRLALSNGWNLVIAGIDSDADVGHVSRKRATARGSFASQCVSLAAALGVFAAL